METTLRRVLSPKPITKIFQFHLPQKGIPCGTQVPLLLQIRRAGPKSSNPLSHEYRATVPGPTELVLNSTVLWAGAPGNPQPTDVSGKRKQKVLLFFSLTGKRCGQYN